MRAVTKQVGEKRLLKLAAFLKKLPRKRFYYGDWVGTDWKGAKDLSCGTTACALGWATVMPEFRRLGLRLKKDRFWGGYVTLAGSRLTHDQGAITAAQKLFAVSEGEAAFLFYPGEYLAGQQAPGPEATPKQVAKHIERFVKNRPEPEVAVVF